MPSRTLPSLTLAALAVLSGCDADVPSTPSPASTPAVPTDSRAASACDACVFGPVVLTRAAGAPVTQRWTFDARAGAAYILDLDDLGTRGANAEIMVNGTPVAWPVDEAGGRVPHARIRLELVASNVLTARLTGKPGSMLRLALEPVVPEARLTLELRPSQMPPTSGALTGPASGTVTGPGIACTLAADVASGDCTESYPLGTEVTLTPAPGARSTFQFWSTGCADYPDTVCRVTVQGDTTLWASFAPAPSYVFLTMTGAGATAWVNGNEILCELRAGVQQGDCDSRYEGGVLAFSLRAYPMNTTFLGWSGACSGTALECPLTSQPGDTVRVTAAFAAP